MNIWDILIVAALVVAVIAAFLYIRKHGGSCEGGCSGCEGCAKAESCKQKK